MFKKALLTIVYLAAVTGLVLFIMKMLKASENRSMPLVYTPTPPPTPYVCLAYESMKEVPVIFDVPEAVTPAVTEAVTTDNSETASWAQSEAPADVTPTRGIMILEENSTPEPTATMSPTNTPEPTATATPTNTPVPTGTPVPTATNTPKPTSTPVPTATTTPTNTPKPIPEYGASDNLKKAGLGRTLDGIAFASNEARTANVMNFSAAGLGNLSGTAILENYDFSDYDFVVLYESFAQTSASVIFKNCRFGNFQKGRSVIGTSVYMEFENCTFRTFLGTDASFKKCVFTDVFEWEFYDDDKMSIEDCLFFDGYESSNKFIFP